MNHTDAADFATRIREAEQFDFRAAVGACMAEQDWRQRLIVTDKGTPKPLLANATTALRHAPDWAGLLRFNEFSAQITVSRAPVWGSPESGAQWTDQQDRLFTEWLQREGIYVGVQVAGLAVQTVAMENPYNPVHDYLISLKWDGVKRIDDWLNLYLAGEATGYIRAIGSRFLVAAVARVLSPVPVKSDCVLVLEGAQGTYKSTAAEIMFSPWFTDHLPDLANKDAYLQLAGVWCVELSEMDTISRASITKVKAFLSARVDRYRLPYGRRAIDVPRHNVFLGTVNKEQYLMDETGGRRFWPVRCGEIRIDDLRRDRDQLWAEAVVRYRSGSVWWLETAELNHEAAREQADRYEPGPWDELIVHWIESPHERLDQQGHPVAAFSSDRESLTVSDVLAHCVGKPTDKWTQIDRNSVARCLAHEGWKRYKQRTGKNSSAWRYRRTQP